MSSTASCGSGSDDRRLLPHMPSLVVPQRRRRKKFRVHHQTLPQLLGALPENRVMRLGCVVLALLGLMYAVVGGLLIGPGDVALGMTATAAGLSGLGWAYWREQ